MNGMNDPDGMNDDELLARLRTTFEALDPVPAGVLAAGRSALAWRHPGGSLAELADDHNRPVAGVRGTPVRLLTFTGSGVTVELEVTGTGTTRDITGRLVPAGPAHVRVRHPARPDHTTRPEHAARTDTAGQFDLADVPEGLVSLIFSLSDATSIVTSWVRL
ncbi:hypothetical protein [Spirillospora sp. NPDC047279]|uniref:hypothetical protein n=1 Tax=Spirillospora sp. NPDC047279 TaxID=3155478 RepID=UPI0033EDCA45